MIDIAKLHELLGSALEIAYREQFYEESSALELSKIRILGVIAGCLLAQIERRYPESTEPPLRFI